MDEICTANYFPVVFVRRRKILFPPWSADDLIISSVLSDYRGLARNMNVKGCDASPGVDGYLLKGGAALSLRKLSKLTAINKVYVLILIMNPS